MAPGLWLLVLDSCMQALGSWSLALGPWLYIYRSLALSMWLLVPAGLLVHGSWSLVLALSLALAWSSAFGPWLLGFWRLVQLHGSCMVYTWLLGHGCHGP